VLSTVDDLEHDGGGDLLFQCLGKTPPRLGELTGPLSELLFKLD
jgi:hypothetical protein